MQVLAEVKSGDRRSGNIAEPRVERTNLQRHQGGNLLILDVKAHNGSYAIDFRCNASDGYRC